MIEPTKTPGDRGFGANERDDARDRDASADGMEVLFGRSGFEQAEPLWRRLEGSVGATPFQSYEWARCWLDRFAPDAEPWLFVRDGARPLLLATALRRVRGVGVLTLLGHGPSDYLGPLPGDLTASDAVALARAITRVRGRFDLLQFRGWFSADASRESLAAALAGRTSTRLYEPCPFVDTTGSWDDYLKARTKKFRANLKRTARRAEQAGQYVIDREEVDEALIEEMISVERESWKWENGFAFLRDARLLGFLRDVLLETTVTRELWTLRFGGQLAAFALTFPSARVRHYYLPSFRARFPDVGTQLLRTIVEDSFSADFEEFDFLQGDEQYKRPWTTGTRNVHEVVSAGRPIIGSLAVRSFEARWRLGRSERLRAWRRRALLMVQRNGRESAS